MCLLGVWLRKNKDLKYSWKDISGVQSHWNLCHVAVSTLEGNLSTRRNTGQTNKFWVEERSSGILTILPSWRWRASGNPTAGCTDVGWTSKSRQPEIPKWISQCSVSRVLIFHIRTVHLNIKVLLTADITFVPCILVLSKFYYQLMHKRIALTL